MLNAGRSPTRRYAVAALSVVVVILIRHLVNAALHVDVAPRFLLFVLAAMFSAWYGGLGPGLLATALAAAAAARLFLEPAGHEPSFVSNLRDMVEAVMFCFIGALTISLNGSLKSEVTERRHAEQTSRAQTQAMVKVIERLRREQSLADLPGIVLAAIVDQLGASGGTLYEYDEVTDVCSMVLDYEEGRVLTPEQMGQSARKAIDHNNIPGWEQVKAHYLRGDCILATGRLRDHPAFDPEMGAALEAMGVRAVLVVPMLLQSRIVGYYAVRSTRQEPYGPGDLEIAQALAHQATLAMQLTRFAEQTRQTAVLEERNRIAREIHDTLAQTFTGILSQLGAAELLLAQQPEQGQAHLQKAWELAREGLTEARRSVQALRPWALEKADLAGALERITRQLNGEQPTRVELRLNGTPRPLPADVAEHLLRIGQEALRNALRHAHARAVLVELIFAAVELRLCVTDDGRGFLADGTQHQEGFGLTGIRERASLIGARLEVESQADHGTQVRVTWPFPPRENK